METSKNLDRMVALGNQLKVITDSLVNNPFIILDFVQIDSIAEIAAQLVELRKEVLIMEPHRTLAMGFITKKSTVTVYAHGDDDEFECFLMYGTSPITSRILTYEIPEEIPNNEQIYSIELDVKDTIEVDSGVIFCPSKKVVK